MSHCIERLPVWLDIVASSCCGPNLCLLNAEVLKFMKQVLFSLGHPPAPKLIIFCMRIPQHLALPVMFHSPHGYLMRKYLISPEENLALSQQTLPHDTLAKSEPWPTTKMFALWFMILLLGSSHKRIYKFCHLESDSFCLL